jgi:hypothetical protein
MPLLRLHCKLVLVLLLLLPSLLSATLVAVSSWEPDAVRKQFLYLLTIDRRRPVEAGT